MSMQCEEEAAPNMRLPWRPPELHDAIDGRPRATISQNCKRPHCPHPADHVTQPTVMSDVDIQVNLIPWVCDTAELM